MCPKHQQPLASGRSSTEDFEELKKKRKILKMTWKNTARLPENLCSSIVILKSNVTNNGAKLLSLTHPVVLSKRDQKLQQLQNTFTLLLSADYQMSKLLPYWGHSPRPSLTYYLQKLSYDIYGIVDHRDGSGYLYLMNETADPKNTYRTISYLISEVF